MNIPEIFIKIGEYIGNKEILDLRLINKNIKKYLENHFSNLSFSDRVFVFSDNILSENIFIIFSKNSGIRFKKIDLNHNNYITDKSFIYFENLIYLNMSYCCQKTITQNGFLFTNKIKVLYLRYCNKALYNIYTSNLFLPNLEILRTQFGISIETKNIILKNFKFLKILNGVDIKWWLQ